MDTDTTGGLDAVATTSRITAAMRAAESARPDRLFADPYADALAGDVGRALAARIDAGDTIPVRTLFGDDAVRAATRAGAGQAVLVAAGMDTRAWRLGLPDGTTVFEVDRAELLALKAEILDGEPPAARRVAVPADLTAGWPAALRAAGFDPGRPACWVVEGLLQYLPEPSVLRLLDDVTALSAAGSDLVVDVVGTGLLASPRARPMLEAMAAAGSPWVFATDDPGGLLGARGWTCTVRVLGDVATGLGRETSSEALGEGRGDEPGYLVHATR